MYRGGFVEHLSRTYVSQQSVAKILSRVFINLVTPKVGAKHELLFNEPATGHMFTRFSGKALHLHLDVE
jgi:hypothetical protein